MKYIDAEKLKAEIERLYNIAEGYLVGSQRQSELSPNQYRMEGAKTFCLNLLSVIDSLEQEQPEVDLEEALNGLDNAYFDLDGIAVVGATYYLTVNDLKDIARDFYELGQLNAR